MEKMEVIKDEISEAENAEEITKDAAKEIAEDAVDDSSEENDDKEESGIKKLLNKNKNSTQYSVAFLLMMLFCSAPIFCALVNREMRLNDEIVYNAYKYNDCCIYISNTIYTLILIFVLAGMVLLARKQKVRETINDAYKREPWLIFWTCLLVWSLAPTLHAIDLRGAFLGATMMSSGYVSYLFSISIMICAFLLKEHEKKTLIKYFVIVSDFLAFITLAFEYDIPFFKDFTARKTGLSVYTNENHYGYYLVVAIMCMIGMFFSSLKEKKEDNRQETMWKYVYLVSLMVNMYTLVLNNTLGAYLAVLFAIIFLMIVWRIHFGKMNVSYWIPLTFLLALTALSYFGVITSKGESTLGYSLVVFVADLLKLKHKSEGYELGGSRRIKIWKETIARIKEHPILGYGPDMMYDENGVMLIETTPHNEFLECAFFLGIPGLVLYLGGLIKLFADRCKGLKKLTSYQMVAAGAVFGYLISSFFGVRKFNTSPYLYMFLGLLLLKNGQEVNKNKKS